MMRTPLAAPSFEELRLLALELLLKSLGRGRRRAACARLVLLVAPASGVSRAPLLLELLAQLLELDAPGVHLLLHRRLVALQRFAAATPAAERASTRCTSNEGDPLQAAGGPRRPGAWARATAMTPTASRERARTAHTLHPGTSSER